MDRLISEQEILKNAFYIKRKGCGLIDVVEVDVIKAIPSAEPCEDAISRQAVQTELKNCEIVNIQLLISNENDNFIGYYNADTVDSIVRNLPSVKPQEKTGQWIEEDMFDGDVAYRCSECNELFWIEDGTPKDNGYDFCPKCGARMIDPQESEEV